MSDAITITVPRRDANHAAFALRRQVETWRAIVEEFPPNNNGSIQGYAELLLEQCNAVERVAAAIEAAEDE